MAASVYDDPTAIPILVMATATALVGLLGFFYMALAILNPPKPKHPSVLPLEDFKPFTLIRKEVLSHDTARFTFGLPSGHVIGLPTGQHIAFKFVDPKINDGKPVQRSYTPVTDNRTVGEIQFVIKVYKPLPPKFPNGGAMSQYVDNLKIGDSVLMKGPKGHLTWMGKGAGMFTVKPLGKPLEERSCTYVGLVAGGTGITPMLQLLHAIFRYPGDASIQGVKLIYANQTVDDILVREELEALQKEFPERFQLWYTVDKAPSSKWEYDTGFVTKDMLEKRLLFSQDASKNQTQFFMCGPPPMVKFALLPNLTELGYTEKDWVVF